VAEEKEKTVLDAMKKAGKPVRPGDVANATAPLFIDITYSLSILHTLYRYYILFIDITYSLLLIVPHLYRCMGGMPITPRRQAARKLRSQRIFGGTKTLRNPSDCSVLSHSGNNRYMAPLHFA